MKAFKRFFALALGLALAGTLAHAQTQISGPYLWVIAPTEDAQGGAASTDLDQLAAATDGAVTEEGVAKNGANEGDQVGGYAWTSIQLPDNGDINAMLVNAGVTDNAAMDDVSSYALIDLESPSAQENVLLACGSDDSIKIWLNGEVVHKNAVNRGRARYQDKVRVNLKAGTNRVLVKVSEAVDGWGMHFGINAYFTAGGVTYHPEEIYIHDLAAADPDHPDLVLGKSVGHIGAVSGFGTGFLVAPNKILSNRHVIGDAAKTHLPVWMTKHETDGPVHGYITEVIFAHKEYDMAVGVINWTRPGFEVPAPLTLMRSSEFDSRFQLAEGDVRIKSIGHSRSGPKTRQIGDYVKHNEFVLEHYPIHALGGSGSPVFFENGNAVVGVVFGIADWTASSLFHDQRHDYFGDLTAVIEAPLDPTAPKLLAGHASDAKSAAYSPDGQAIAVGSGDGAIRIWNAVWSGVPKAPIHTLRGHTAGVLSVAYSPNGQTIASGSYDDTIRIWDANTGAHLRTLTGHRNNVWSVAYSPDGQTIVSGSDDSTVRIWNASAGEEIRALQGHTSTVNSVAYSPDGRTIVSGSADNTIRIWNADTGAEIQTLQGHTAAVHSVAYSPDGRTIASGSADDTIRVWDPNTGTLVRTLEGHTNDVVSAAYSPDGLTIASGSRDSTVRIWNANTGAPMQTLEWYKWWRPGAVWFAAYSPDSQKIVSRSPDDTIRIWNIAIRPIASVSGPSESQTGAFDVKIAFSSAVTGFTSSDIVVTNGSATNLAGSGASYTATIEPSSSGAVTVSVPANAASNVWGSSEASNIYSVDYRAQQVLTGHTKSVISIAYSPDGQTIASGSGDNTIGLWNADTGEHLRTLQGHTNQVRSVAYSPDGQTLVSGGFDETIRIWNANTGAEIRTLQYPNWVFTTAYSPDGQTIAGAGGGAGTIPIWNADTGAHIRTLQGHNRTVYSVAYSPDGQTIASGSGDNTIRLWNANTGEHIRTLQGHTDRVRSVAYSPDGLTIASGSWDYKIRIWNAETGALIRALEGHTAAVWSVAYSPDGQTLASGSDDKTIRTWNANTGAHLRTLKGHTGKVFSVDYSPDGQTLASGSSDNTVRIWGVSDLASPPTTTSFTAQLRQGLNMLHVPVNDPQLEKLSDLYAALGGSQDVQFLVAYSPESNLFKAYTEGLAGSDLLLSDETAVIASMKSAKSVTFTGGLLKREVSLRAGMNMIGVTRAGAVETIGDLTSLTTVPLTVIALKHDDTGNALFQLANDSTDAAKGGEGYIVLADAETVLTFDGSAWSNDAATSAASAGAAAYDPSATPLLVVEGSVAREDNLEPLNGLEISITNLQTGQTASDLAGSGSASGGFSLPLLALTEDSYAIGDAFDLRVSDSSGTLGVQSVRVVLDKESVSAGKINIGQLLATAIPTKSALLPNYPNPFNPETWIPFDLSEASRVAVTIYNAAGQTVRVLQLGELPAGTYRSRSRSAHWDGRNSLGEPVASGVYYVRIEAGSFTALRRMVVLK